MYYIYRFPLGLLLLLLLLLFKWKFITFVMWKSYIEETISHLIFAFFFLSDNFSHIYFFVWKSSLLRDDFSLGFIFLFLEIISSWNDFSLIYLFIYFVKIVSWRDDLFLTFLWKSSPRETISHFLNFFEIVSLRGDFSYKK